MSQQGSRGDGFLELEEVNERIERIGQQSFDSIHEVLVHSKNGSESPVNIELPMLTPLTEKSIQNIDPQVILNPIFDDFSEINVFQF